MSASLALSLWLSVAGQLPIATQAQLPTGETVELAAEQLLYEPKKQILTLRGNTVLRSESVLLRADEITYDQKEEKAAARGNVMLVAAGNVAAVAEEIQIDIRSFEATVKGGLFMQKRNVSQEALLAAKTPEELKALGDTAILIKGTRIRRTDTAAFSVEDISFTPCDCKPWEPSWRVEASKASVEVGEHAVLSWPRVYIYDVPVLALPWIDLPLADRRTGLLVPRPLTGPRTGFGLEQPVFFELGPSYDVTLSPTYYGGTAEDGNFGVKGPRLFSEFRYAPQEKLRGRVALSLLYDLWQPRHPLYPDRKIKDAAGNDTARGLRGELIVQHAHELPNGFHTRVDAATVSDGWYTDDLQADVLLREVTYLTSSAVAYHRGDDHYAGLDVVLRQPLKHGFGLFRVDRNEAGEGLHGPNPLHRLPGLTAGLPVRHLWGPVFGGVDAEASRIAPLVLGHGDEGTDGVFDLSSVEGRVRGQGNRSLDPGERQARYRLTLHPQVSVPLALGAFARVTPYLRYRQSFHYGEFDHAFSQRGYGLLGALVETELSRTFGDRLRHAITPRAEIRFVPRIFGAPLGYYDEQDRAPVTLERTTRYSDVLAVTEPEPMGQPGFLHALTEVSQRLSLRADGQVRELGRLDLGQTADLGLGATRPRLGESYARLSFSLDRYQLEGTVRLDPLRKFVPTQLSASAGVNDGRGNGLYARYDYVLTPGSERMRRPLDAFVSQAPAGDSSTTADWLVAGGNYNLPFGLSLRYEAVIDPGAKRPVTNEAISPLVQQNVGIAYGPACGCWRLEVSALIPRDDKRAESLLGFGEPQLAGTLTLGQFGTFGR